MVTSELSSMRPSFGSCRSDQDLDRRRVAEKARRAGGQAVCARLEDHDEIADVGPGQAGAVREHVEWRAEAPDHAHGLGLLVAGATGDRDGVVAPDDLAEVPGCGELV